MSQLCTGELAFTCMELWHENAVYAALLIKSMLEDMSRYGKKEILKFF